MAVWQDFKSFFSTQEQNLIEYGFISEVQSTYGINHFSGVYSMSEETIREILTSTNGSFRYYLVEFIFSKAAAVPLTGTNEEQWLAFKNLFSNDYKDSIQFMIDELKKAPYNHTFASFQSTNSGNMNSIIQNKGKNWGFTTFFAAAFKNRIKQATDGWNVMESFLQGAEREETRELFTQFDKIPPYEDFPKVPGLSATKVGGDLRTFIHHYQSPRDFLDFLIDELVDKINSAKLLNLSDDQLKAKVLSEYRPEKAKAIEALYKSLVNSSMLARFTDIPDLPLKTGVTDTDLDSETVLGFQLQPNSDFSESIRGWYSNTGIQTPIDPSYIISEQCHFINGRSIYSPWKILEIGKEYRLEYDIAASSDASNEFKVYDGSTQIDTITNPSVETRVVEFTATNYYLRYTMSAGTGYIRLDNVKLYEKIKLKKEPVIVSQEAGASQPQISHVYPFAGSASVGDKFILYLNNITSFVIHEYDGNNTNSLDEIKDAINLASTDAYEGWDAVTAVVDTDHIVVTAGANNVEFDLGFFSLKRHILSLESSHDFYNFLAQDFLDNSKAAFNKNTETFTFNGRLMNNVGNVPLADLRVVLWDTGVAPHVNLGSEITNGSGYFSYTYKVTYPAEATKSFKLEYFNGNKVGETTFYHVMEDQNVETITISFYPIQESSATTITSVANATGLSIPVDLQNFLNSNAIYTLAAIRNAGGIKYMPGLPVAQDSTAVVQLDAHASLNATSKNILANHALILSGKTTPLDIAIQPRHEIVKSQEIQNVGSFNASSNYYTSRAYGRLLQNLITSHLAAKANNHSKGALSDELDPVFEQSCTCKDCNSAVSPLAYLTDLLNYTIQFVRNNEAAIDISFLESNFFQQFRNLPHSCKSVEELVCQQRVAIEILRRYISTLSLPSENQETLADENSEYCFAVYRDLLKEIGTSYEQIRNYRNATDDEKAQLAESLSFPFSETFDPFIKLFVDPDDEAMNEATLEMLFGIVDTRRENFSTGAKLGDTSSQITRWQFSGIEYLKNTDEEGFVYLKITSSPDEVRIYNNADVGNESYLVGIASASGEAGRLSIDPQNESSLSGDLYITDFTPSTSVKVSLLPMVMCWRLKKSKELWEQNDWQANDFVDHLVPVIDPDIIGADDFRLPDSLVNEPFKIWETRRSWVDNRLQDFRDEKPDVQDMLDLMGTQHSYTTIASSVINQTPWSAVPDLAAFKAIYNDLKSGSAADVADAEQEIANLKLTTPGFLRLYEIYNSTFVSDERGLVIKLQQGASASLKQITHLIPGTVKPGDYYEVTYVGTGSVNFTAATSEISDLLTGLKTAMETASWDLVPTLSVNSDYLILTGAAVDTSFQVKTKVNRVPSDAALEEVISILTQAVKVTFYADWITEENTETVTINSNDFWKPVSEPGQGEWPVLSTGVPMIDPELVSLQDLAGATVGAGARALLQTRIGEMITLIDTLRATQEENGIEAVLEEAWGSGYLDTYANLEEILFDLQNPSDLQAAEAAAAFIESDLYITTDEFKILMQIREKSFNLNDAPVTSDEWNTLFSILASANKKRDKYSTWLGQEASYSYWEVFRAALPQWRATSEQRNQWRRGLELVSRQPAVDPDIVRPDYLAEIDQNENAYLLWNARNEALTTLFNNIKGDYTDQIEEEENTEVEAFDFLINKYVVTTTESARLIQLFTDGHAGVDVSAEVKQLNLTFEALEFLIIVRDVLNDSPSAILPEEIDSVCSILVQVQKERSFSTWIMDEREERVNITPDHFRISKYFRQNFLSAAQERVMHWRANENVRRDWLDKLEGRIVTRENTFTFFKEIVDRTEDTHLISLRDALVRATITDGTPFGEQAEDLSEKLLVDVENNCCQKTTRVAQAIEALQLLFFSMRTGQLQDDYPDLSIQSDYFDEEWKWLGSYANWRSAMFVTLYPENVLHPAFRQTGSTAYFELVDNLRNNNRLSPEQACAIAAEYYAYIKDIANLKMVGRVSGETFVRNSVTCGSSTSESKELQFIFAQAEASKNIYWSTLDGNDAAVFSPRPWEVLPGFADAQVGTPIGATRWEPSKTESYILFFVNTYKEGKDSISYAKFNLNSGAWDPERTDLDIPEIEGAPADKAVEIYLNKSVNKFEDVVFAIKKGPKVQFFELGGKGSDLLDFTNPNTSLKPSVDDENTTVEVVKIYDFIDLNLLYTSEDVTKVTRTVPDITHKKVTWTNLTGKSKSEDYVILPIELGNANAYIRKQDGTTKVVKLIAFNNVNILTIVDTWKNVTEYVRSSTSTSIGNNKISDFDISEYKGSFIWPEGQTDSNTAFLFFQRPNDAQTYYRLFFTIDKKLESNWKDNVSTFATNPEFISLFQDLHGKTYALYQRITGNPGIFIAPIYKSTITYDGDARSNNILNFKPASSIVKISYNFTNVNALNPNTDRDTLKTTTEINFKANSGLPHTLFQVIPEAYYFVPMMVALSLQSKGYYVQALDWFRLVYAYDKPESESGFVPQKIWYGLIHEGNYLGDIKRTQNWLRDPLNPHAIAETRAYAYTKFTIQSIVRCLMDFADSEFTKDTAESVPRARVLYETALDMLELEGLRNPDTNCAVLINDLTLPSDITDSPEWPEWLPVWLEIIEDLYKIEDKDSLTNVISLIETALADEEDSIDEKLSSIRDLVDDSLETPEHFTDFAALISSGRILTNDALNRVLMNSDIQAGLKYFASETGKHYLNAVTSVTGLVPDALLSDKVYISWFGDHVKLVQEVPGPQSVTTLTGPYTLNPYFARKNAYYNHLNPTAQQVRTMTVISNPIKVINNFYGNEQIYTPQLNPNFCVPQNPVLNSLILSGEANLYKIRNCMNIAGIVRQLQPYAAATDQSTGIPILGGDGELILTGNQNFQPSIYRFDVLIERAKQQVAIAQQIEATLLSLYEKSDGEHYSLLKAKQDLRIANAGVKLQDLRLKEADSNIVLTQLQKDRVSKTAGHFQELLNNGWLGSEMGALASLIAAQGFSIASSLVSFATSSALVAAAIADSRSGLVNKLHAAGSTVASALGSLSQAASTQSSIFSMLANYERRNQEWQFQLELAQQDLLISNQQITIAKQRRQIVDQERQIAVLQSDHAEQTLDFLAGKFTNAELYDWMARILEKVYSYFLYQATATAKVAQGQLAFERQEAIQAFIQDDYWEAPSSNALSIGGNSGPDRRGLTGSARLLKDISELDQFSFDTEKRKLQLSKTISLMRMAPTEFQRFKETGIIRFQTLMDQFDRDFPGHYLRLVKQVKASVIALVPPVDGIKATLRNAGLSYVVNGTDFRKTYIVRPPDSVSLTSPFNATGLFELNQQNAKLLNPFENVGVESTWEFIMPKAANFFDYSTIADVMLTIDYTALESRIYRNEVIQEIGTSFEGDRPFSFKNNFADQWFDLSNPENDGKVVTVSFTTTKADFPANLSNLKMRAVSLFFATNVESKNDQQLSDDGKQSPGGGLGVKLNYNEASENQYSKQDTASDFVQFNKVLSSAANLENWDGLIQGKSPVGEWQLTLTSGIISKILSEEITDISFVLTVKGTTPEWPSY